MAGMIMGIYIIYGVTVIHCNFRSAFLLMSNIIYLYSYSIKPNAHKIILIPMEMMSPLYYLTNRSRENNTIDRAEKLEYLL